MPTEYLVFTIAGLVVAVLLLVYIVLALASRPTNSYSETYHYGEPPLSPGTFQSTNRKTTTYSPNGTPEGDDDDDDEIDF
jgi:hypothetical protein